jgi:plastocyanin
MMITPSQVKSPAASAKWAVGAIAALLSSSAAWAVPQQIQISQDAGMPAANAAVAVFVKGSKSTAAPGATADLAQKNKTFVPSLLVVQTGTAVHFPNFDTVRHHVYSFSPIKTFEIKLYAGTPAAPVVFDKPGTATMGCNIHDRMLAYIHVVDTPYFGVTDANGMVTLDLPAGEHRIHVWLPSMGENNAGLDQAFKTSATPAVIHLKP